MRFIQKRSRAQRIPRTHRMSADYLVKTKHSENVIIEEKDDFVQLVDVVIPYVDGDREEYIKLYNEYNPNNPMVRDRYHQCNTLKYVLRSIDLFLPFVNNVFLIVQSDDQVPEWVNRVNVKVVKHEDFIPSQFLPTFNSICICSFAHLIDGLGERFIYFNDDFILNNKLLYKDVFNGDRPKFKIYKHKGFRGDEYGHHINNGYEYAFGVKPKDFIPYPFHHIFPRTKISSDFIYGKAKKDIFERNTTKIRDIINFYPYEFCGYAYGFYDDINLSENYTECHNDNDYNNIKNILNSNQKLICINSTSEEYEDKIIDLLENKFSEKSKYEN